MNGCLRGKKDKGIHTNEQDGEGDEEKKYMRDEVEGIHEAAIVQDSIVPHCRHYLCRSHRKTRPCHLTGLKEPAWLKKCMYVRFEYIAFSTDNYNLKNNVFNEKSSVLLHLNCQLRVQTDSTESSIPIIIID